MFKSPFLFLQHFFTSEIFLLNQFWLLFLFHFILPFNFIIRGTQLSSFNLKIIFPSSFIGNRWDLCDKEKKKTENQTKNSHNWSNSEENYVYSSGKSYISAPIGIVTNIQRTLTHLRGPHLNDIIICLRNKYTFLCVCVPKRDQRIYGNTEETAKIYLIYEKKEKNHL